MPRSLTAAVSTAALEEVTNFVTCWRVVLSNGTTYGFTSHVEDIVVSAVTYVANGGYTPSSVDSSNRWNVDNLEVIGVVTGTGINVDDIEAGEFDGADVTMFMVDFTQPAAGQITLRTGTVGTISRRDNDFTAELRGLLQKAQQTATEVYAPLCRATFGDAKCKVPVSAAYWTSVMTVSAYTSGDAGISTNAYIRSTTLTSRYFKATAGGATGTAEPSFTSIVGNTTNDGTVTWETIYAWRRSAVVSSVADAANFKLADMDEPVDHWKQGVCEFKTGNNANRSMEIKANSSAGVIELYLPMPASVNTSDVVVLTAGCAKRMTEDCVGKYNNIFNFRGEPFIPGQDSLTGGGKTR
jgi:hypothetical protein